MTAREYSSVETIGISVALPRVRKSDLANPGLTRERYVSSASETRIHFFRAGITGRDRFNGQRSLAHVELRTRLERNQNRGGNVTLHPIDESAGYVHSNGNRLIKCTFACIIDAHSCCLSLLFRKRREQG